MSKLAILLACVALSGCAAIQAGAGTVGNYLCQNRENLRQSLLVTQANAMLLTDPVVRDSILMGVQAQLNALSLCPIVSPVTPGAL